jgi:cyclopropane fatty-acyl-phospholipid synthase-like methyltransferase
MAPQQQDVTDFYDEASRLLAELAGGSLHFGYWDSPDGDGAMEAASRRLTEFMIEKIRVASGDRVLDIGCGTGKPAMQLARATNAEVVGVTISAYQVARATEQARAEGLDSRVTFQRADAMDLPFPAGSFDAVWLFESIFHMPDRVGALRQAATVLRPGGRLALTDVLTDPVRDTADKPFSALFGEPIQLGDYQRLLIEAGLEPVEVTDITAHTVGCSLNSFRQTITRNRDRFVAEFGAELVDQVYDTVPALLTAGIGYAIVSASRPR